MEEASSAPSKGAASAEKESALEHDIRTKGKNSYYYAHQKKDEWDESMVWDGNEAPRLLSKGPAKSVAPAPGGEVSKGPKALGGAAPTETKIVDRAAPVKGITSYAWDDQGLKVKVYITLEAVGELSNAAIDLAWQENSFKLVVKGYKGVDHVMEINTYNKIKGAKVKKKPNKLILILEKRKDYRWSSLNAV